MATSRGNKKVKILNSINYDKLTVTEVLCPICRSILIEPVSLPCSHVFCSHCFEETVQNTNLVCPLCRFRIGSWLRITKKQKKLINEPYWNAIQKLFPNEIKNKLEGIEENLDYESPVIRVTTPGEIKKEYEIQKKKVIEELLKEREAEEKASAELIRQLQEEDAYQRSLNEEKLKCDEELAKKLSKELQSSEQSPKQNKCVVRLGKKIGTIDKFLKIDQKEQAKKTLKINNNFKNVVENDGPKKSVVEEISIRGDLNSNSDNNAACNSRFFKPINIESKSVFQIVILRPQKTYVKDCSYKPCSPKGKRNFTLSANSSAFAMYSRPTTSSSIVTQSNTQDLAKKSNSINIKHNSTKKGIKVKTISKKPHKKNHYQSNIIEMLKIAPKASINTSNQNQRFSKRIGLRNKISCTKDCDIIKEVEKSPKTKLSPKNKKSPSKYFSPCDESIKSLRSNIQKVEVEIHRSASPIENLIEKSPTKGAKENSFNSERLISLRSRNNIIGVQDLSPLHKSIEKNTRRSSTKRSPAKNKQINAAKIASLKKKGTKIASEMINSELIENHMLLADNSENMLTNSNSINSNGNETKNKCDLIKQNYLLNNATEEMFSSNKKTKECQNTETTTTKSLNIQTKNKEEFQSVHKYISEPNLLEFNNSNGDNQISSDEIVKISSKEKKVIENINVSLDKSNISNTITNSCDIKENNKKIDKNANNTTDSHSKMQKERYDISNHDLDLQLDSVPSSKSHDEKVATRRLLLRHQAFFNKKSFDMIDMSEDIRQPNNVPTIISKDLKSSDRLTNRKRKLQEQLDYEFAKKMQEEEMSQSYYPTRASLRQQSFDEVIIHVYK